jgi:hypothetical protein
MSPILALEIKTGKRDSNHHFSFFNKGCWERNKAARATNRGRKVREREDSHCHYFTIISQERYNMTMPKGWPKIEDKI